MGTNLGGLMGAHARLAMGVLIPSCIGVAAEKSNSNEKIKIPISSSNFMISSNILWKYSLEQRCTSEYLCIETDQMPFFPMSRAKAQGF